MKLNVLLIILLSLLLTTLIDENAYAQERLIFGTGEWEPITSSKAKEKGLASEIVRKVFEIEGIEIEIKFYPWKRCESLLKKEQLNAIFPYNKTDERTKFYDFSDPIVTVKTEFFYLKENIKELSFQKYEDLQKYKIGGEIGYFYEKVFEKAKLNVEYVTSTKQNISKMLAGRIDITPIANVVGWYIIKNQFPNESERFSTTDFDIPANRKTDEEIAGRLLVLKNHVKSNEIINIYNQGLVKLKQNGQYDKIFLKYGIDINRNR